MYQALINIKTLLIKWAVVYAALVILLVSLFYDSSASSNQTKATFQRAAIINEDSTAAGLEDEVSDTIKSPHNILPPFKSESDIIISRSTGVNLTPNADGNTYYRGNCTWYAKFKRPDLPNSLGNADTWLIRARALGLPTGSEPRVGAIGQQGMHVVYVEGVNSDGTVLISEMNYKGYGIISHRTVASSSFQYIY